MSIEDELRRLGQARQPVTGEETDDAYTALLASYEHAATDPAQMLGLHNQIEAALLRQAAYELGVLYAQTGRQAEAAQWLQEALSRGYAAAEVPLARLTSIPFLAPAPPTTAPQPCADVASEPHSTVPGPRPEITGQWPGHTTRGASLPGISDPGRTALTEISRARQEARAELAAAREKAMSIVAIAHQQARELRRAAEREAAEVIVAAYDSSAHTRRAHGYLSRTPYPLALAQPCPDDDTASTQVVLWNAVLVDESDEIRSQCVRVASLTQSFPTTTVALLCFGIPAIQQSTPQALTGSEPDSPAPIRRLMDWAGRNPDPTPTPARVSSGILFDFLRELVAAGGPASPPDNP